MKNYLIASAFALASGFVAILLPTVSEIGGLRHPTNLPIGFLYGFAWYVAGFFQSIRSHDVQTHAGKAWPLIVMVAITYFVGRALSQYPEKRRTIIIGCTVLLLLVMPSDLVQSTPLKYIPTWYGFMAAVY